MCHNVSKKKSLAGLSVAWHPPVCKWVSVGGRLCYIQHKEFMSRWMTRTACCNWMTPCNNVATRHRVYVENDVSSGVARFRSCGNWKSDSAVKMQPNPGARFLISIRLCTCFAYFEKKSKQSWAQAFFLFFSFFFTHKLFCLWGFSRLHFVTLLTLFPSVVLMYFFIYFISIPLSVFRNTTN